MEQVVAYSIFPDLLRVLEHHQLIRPAQFAAIESEELKQYLAEASSADADNNTNGNNTDDLDMLLDGASASSLKSADDVQAMVALLKDWTPAPVPAETDPTAAATGEVDILVTESISQLTNALVPQPSSSQPGCRNWIIQHHVVEAFVKVLDPESKCHPLIVSKVCEALCGSVAALHVLHVYDAVEAVMASMVAYCLNYGTIKSVGTQEHNSP
jgi:hypothetical protein